MPERDLATTDPHDDVLVARFHEYRRTGDIRCRNDLVEAHLHLAQQEAGRFAGRGELHDDLLQVARIGLIKAVERYDPGRGVPFGAFARPTISGELRRHFRDATWGVRVPRGLKELHGRVGPAIAVLTQRLGRRPRTEEVAQELGCTVDEVLEALDVASAYRPASLSVAGEAREPMLDPASDDDVELRTVDRTMVDRLLAELDPRERLIVHLRFAGELSQSEIADRVGISQMHVSRLLRGALHRLQAQVGQPTPSPTDTSEGAT